MNDKLQRALIVKTNYEWLLEKIPLMNKDSYEDLKRRWDDVKDFWNPVIVYSILRNIESAVSFQYQTPNHKAIMEQLKNEIGTCEILMAYYTEHCEISVSGYDSDEELLKAAKDVARPLNSLLDANRELIRQFYQQGAEVLITMTTVLNLDTLEITLQGLDGAEQDLIFIQGLRFLKEKISEFQSKSNIIQKIN